MKEVHKDGGTILVPSEIGRHARRALDGATIHRTRLDRSQCGQKSLQVLLLNPFKCIQKHRVYHDITLLELPLFHPPTFIVPGKVPVGGEGGPHLRGAAQLEGDRRRAARAAGVDARPRGPPQPPGQRARHLRQGVQEEAQGVPGESVRGRGAPREGKKSVAKKK